jgi:hypothetical protein
MLEIALPEAFPTIAYGYRTIENQSVTPFCVAHAGRDLDAITPEAWRRIYRTIVSVDTLYPWLRRLVRFADAVQDIADIAVNRYQSTMDLSRGVAHPRMVSCTAMENGRSRRHESKRTPLSGLANSSFESTLGPTIETAVAIGIRHYRRPRS